MWDFPFLKEKKMVKAYFSSLLYYILCINLCRKHAFLRILRKREHILIKNILVNIGSTYRRLIIFHLFCGTLPSWNSVLWKRTFYDTVVKCALCFTGSVVECDKSLGLRQRINDLKLPLCHAGLICLSRYGLIRTCLTDMSFQSCVCLSTGRAS